MNMINDEVRQLPLLRKQPQVVAAPFVAPSATASLPTLKIVTGLVVGIVFGLSIILGAHTAFTPVFTGIGKGWAGVLTGLLGPTTGPALASKTAWTIARTGGVMAYIFSFFTVLLGLLTHLGLMDRYFRRAQINTLHRSTTVALLVFVTLHGLGLIFDSYSQVHLTDLIFPFLSGYRTFWTGLGTVAFELMLAVAVTAWLARRVGFKVWRTIHYASFAIFYGGLAHGVMAGSDTGSAWLQVVYVVTGLVITGLCVRRFVFAPAPKRNPRKSVTA